MRILSMFQLPGSGARQIRVGTSIWSSLSPCWLLVLLLLAVQPASAAVYTCPDGNGDVQFQDRQCERTQADDARTSSTSRSTASQGARTLPAGADPSWFATPDGVAHQAFCDESGCECGPFVRSFDSGLTFAVADALYLDGAWHRYQSSIESLLDATQSGENARAFALRTEVEAAACDILMSQQTLRQYADRELRKLQRRAQNAEDLGRDSEASCDGFSEAACRDYQAVLTYRSMQLDAKALGQPRGTTVSIDLE